MLSSQHASALPLSDLQNRSVDAESESLESLKLQIHDAMVPPPLDKIKALLLSIVTEIVPNQAEKDDELSLFVKRIVDISMNVLILLEVMNDKVRNKKIQHLESVLEAIRTLAVSANRWKLYPCSGDGLKTVLTTKGRGLEGQLTSILNILKVVMKVVSESRSRVADVVF